MAVEEVASIRFGQLCPNFGARVEDALLVILVHFEGVPKYPESTSNAIRISLYIFVGLATVII